jgi:serine/threonine protein kinase
MSLAPDDLKALSRWLDEGLALPEAARVGWLDQLPAEAAPLAPTLRRLLSAGASRETADLLDRGPAFAPPTDASAPGESGVYSAGDVVGPYRLLRTLGAGGMGEVWLAERADGQLKRQVALKMPRIGWAPTLAERFKRERDILSSLEHPHIARLYDGGVDALGRPYMALEYVEGRPIDEFCNTRALGITERLRLLLQAADAVAFAHSRLVLHRDLKPSNILVTADGQVRLLDFGIAKLMEGGQAAETALTVIGGRALTLDYASPEQIRGEAVGTQSDVYALGVVAFELLAGQRPYRLKRGSAAELEEAITSQDLPLASTVARAPESRRRLRGDLDAILHKALKKAVAERYATVDALASDWRRFLDGGRVLARPDSPWRRLSRFAVRQRVPLMAALLALSVFVLAVGVGATAVVIVALAAGLGAALLQARRATAERDRALALAERNAAVNVFLDTLLARAARAGPLTAVQLLERSETLVENEVRGNPEHRAYVLSVLATATRSSTSRRARPHCSNARSAPRRTWPTVRCATRSRAGTPWCAASWVTWTPRSPPSRRCSRAPISRPRCAPRPRATARCWPPGRAIPPARCGMRSRPCAGAGRRACCRRGRSRCCSATWAGPT